MTLPFFAALLVTALTTTFAGAQVRFSEGTFAENLRRAGAEDKMLLVHAYADWCGECRKMDETTYTHGGVANFVDSNFVAMRMNMEVGFGVDLAMKHRVTSFPEFLIFKPNGRLKARLKGYMEPAEFVRALEDAEASPPLPERAHPLEFDLPYPDFLRRAYASGREKHYPETAAVEAYLDTRDSLTDEVSWAVISRFVTGGRYADSTVANRGSLIARYGEKEVNDKLASFVFARVKSAIKDRDNAQFARAMDEADRTLGAYASEYKLKYRLYFYQMTGNWAGLAEIGDRLAAETLSQTTVETLQGLAQILLQNSSGQSHLNAASEWMKLLIEHQPKYAFLHTRAALLYKLGENEQAIATAQDALEYASKEGADAAATHRLIDEMKSP